MNIEQLRAAFEACFSKLPFEWELSRYGEDSAWPGDYQKYEHQCAWEGWLARAALQSQDREDAERYRWLRDGGNDDIGVVRGFDCIDSGSTTVVGTYEWALDGEQLDAAIDHARRVEGEAGDAK